LLFNTLEFAIFLPIVFILYWFVFHKSIKVQNTLLFAASYVFYGWWDIKFLGLILFSTCLDFLIGKALAKTEKAKARKLLLVLSLLFNLGLLFVFKYYNFFIESFAEGVRFFGAELGIGSLSLILPVGISFYTFQTLSYTIDVYNRKIDSSNDFISFGAFVSFFPQLVAGPIERASNLLPQFGRSRKFESNKAIDGLRQILWGLFKKVVIADNCAEVVNICFENPELHSGSFLLIGAVFFAFQIYGDFSGYSDIAIGVARLFGFNLIQNFAFPYFSRDIGEFWRRWHISLSTWFRDYLYIPLGGSKGGMGMKIRNTFVIFLVSGFWHGANWTFIIWGALNAIYFLPLLISGNNRNNLEIVAINKRLPSLKEILQIILTFSLTCIAWVFFRANNITEAFEYLSGIFSASLLQPLSGSSFAGTILHPFLMFALIGIFILIEWNGRKGQYALEHIDKKIPKVIRWVVYLLLILATLLLSGENQTFIYFQF
jgi:alginate O-acetyltransferase complex protein AlgI